MPGTVYANATFLTLDPRRGGRGAPATTTALACLGERVIAVGDLAECREAAGAGAEEVDLGGAYCVPGFTDAHIHLASYARHLVWVDLRDAGSLEEAVRRVAAHAAGSAGDGWVLGGRWDFNRWSPPVAPDKAALDAVCPARPVGLASHDGHTLWVNSEGLRRAGIDRDTPDPAGGEIVRDERGEPTGLLREAVASAVRQRAEAESSADLTELLAPAFERVLGLGLTGVHDLDGEDARAAYERLAARGALPLRVHKSIPLEALPDAIAQGRRTGVGDVWLRTGPVKVFADGALGSHSAAMSRPYAGEPGNTGIEVTPPEALREIVEAAAAAGIAVAAHAIGDKAVRSVLDAFAAGRPPGGAGRLRYRIEHAQHIAPADLPRLAELGVIASMQPIHATSDADLADALLSDHDLRSYAWRSLADSGAVLAFGSDAPVEDPSPLAGLHAALTRQRGDGTPAGGWQPAERLDLARALAAYTAGPAYASYEEDVKGWLAPGRLADFVALSDDLFALPAEDLRHVTVQATVVGGVVRWSR